jgi:CheY-like chemotaxis protein
MTARVLVVDDVLANVKLLQARLSAEYFEVLTASNGHEALELLETERVDVVLLDVMMPGMDGPATFRAMQEDPALQDVPVVFLTAKMQVGGAQPWDGLDIAGVIPKPFDPMSLAAQVSELVGWDPA